MEYDERDIAEIQKKMEERVKVDKIQEIRKAVDNTPQDFELLVPAFKAQIYIEHLLIELDAVALYVNENELLKRRLDATKQENDRLKNNDKLYSSMYEQLGNECVKVKNKLNCAIEALEWYADMWNHCIRYDAAKGTSYAAIDEDLGERACKVLSIIREEGDKNRG